MTTIKTTSGTSIRRVHDHAKRRSSFTDVNTGKTVICGWDKIPGYELVAGLDDGHVFLRLVAHAINAFVGDAGTTALANNADPIESMRARWKTVLSGKWSERGTGGTRLSDTVRAYGRAHGLDDQTAKSQWAKLGKDAQKAEKKTVLFQKATAELMAERANAILAELSESVK